MENVSLHREAGGHQGEGSFRVTAGERWNEYILELEGDYEAA